MSLGRVSAIALLMLSLGSAVALADTNPPSPQVFAQKPDGSMRPQRVGDSRGVSHRSRLMQELNLTQEQMQRLDALHQQSKKQMEQPRQALRQAKQDLANLMASNADENAIRAKHNQLQQLQQQMANVRFQNMLEMRKVLTPEQRQRFAQLMQQRRGNSRNRPGNPAAPPQ